MQKKSLLLYCTQLYIKYQFNKQFSTLSGNDEDIKCYKITSYKLNDSSLLYKCEN